jgi:hypothetical protein
MKQILQQPRTGDISVSEVQAPGTERASSEFANKNLLQKAQARPDLVLDVLGKVRRDGLFCAVQAIRSRLDQPLALGYSSAGRVVGIGERVTDIRVVRSGGLCRCRLCSPRRTRLRSALAGREASRALFEECERLMRATHSAYFVL